MLSFWKTGNTNTKKNACPPSMHRGHEVTIRRSMTENQKDENALLQMSCGKKSQIKLTLTGIPQKPAIVLPVRKENYHTKKNLKKNILVLRWNSLLIRNEKLWYGPSMGKKVPFSITKELWCLLPVWFEIYQRLLLMNRFGKTQRTVIAVGYALYMRTTRKLHRALKKIFACYLIAMIDPPRPEIRAHCLVQKSWIKTSHIM